MTKDGIEAQPSRVVKSSAAQWNSTYHLRATLEQCWDHWTKPQLFARWFGEVDLTEVCVGADFPVRTMLPYQEAQHVVTEVQPRVRLGFRWQLAELTTELTVGFEAAGEGTKITLEQSATLSANTSGFLGFDPQRLSLQGQIWDFALSNLRCLLEDGGPGVEIRSVAKPSVVALHVSIHASPREVFAALTKLPELRHWERMCLENAALGRGVGERYSFGWESEVEGGDGPDRIVQYEPGARLVYSWFGAPASLVRWQLAATSVSTTRVTFEHGPLLLSEDAVWEYRLGWASSLFALKWYLERGEQGKAWIIQPS